MNTKQTKIGVLVSGGGTNLQALIDAQERGELGNGRISLVIASKPDVYALERAKKHAIDSLVLARKEYDSIAAYSKALADALEAAEIDLVVLAGFLTIIDEQVYERFPNRILNVHPALIPSFCRTIGPASHSGVTICTVAPDTRTPFASAASCTCRP